MTSAAMRRRVDALAKPGPGWVMRQGVVMALNITGPTGQTVDVQIGGSTTTIQFVPYQLPATPVVGQGVWLWVNGKDAFVFGSFGPADGIAFPYGAGFGDAAGFHVGEYFKDASGIVVLGGVATATALATAPKTIGTLPAGYRPNATQAFTVYATTAPCRVDVTSAGAVILQTTQANGNNISLNQIQYLAEA